MRLIITHMVRSRYTNDLNRVKLLTFFLSSVEPAGLDPSFQLCESFVYLIQQSGLKK